jgi:prepilin-type N-terminal cleavage/methylation domain-containing protein
MVNTDTALRGFTLIELSIVLVIIGLIVGGVLVGRDLIAAAGLRATISQIEKYNAAVNAFHLKYDCLPGDCPNATNYLPNLANTWGTGNGNGDGIIEDDVGGSYPARVEEEPIAFWMQLSAAGLTDCCTQSAYTGAFVIGKTFPQAKTGNGGISVASINSVNGYYWGISTNTGISGWADTCGGVSTSYCDLSPTGTGVITPAQAQTFDNKVDDGNPATGNVYAVFVWNGTNTLYPQANPVLTFGYIPYNCLSSSLPPAYNISFGAPACNLWINMQGM